MHAIRQASRLVHTRGFRSTSCSAALADCAFKANANVRHGTAAKPVDAATCTEAKPLSAYVHLPFCKRRCYYCDFPVQAVGPQPDAGPVQNVMQQYVDLLCQEVRSTAPIGGEQLQTIFFGGGTPSLIPPHMLQQVLETLADQFGVVSGAEISMEADPGTFDAQRLQNYMALGVSRFSIGIQAFQQDVLEACGRSHSLPEVYQAIEDVHAAGVGNWSLDLISGLPFASEAAWQHSLDEALAAEPYHISIYDLQVEEKTKFGRWYAPGQFPLPADEATAKMYCAASATLRGQGMEHYEVSSYAKPGHRCQHNMVYWSGAPFHAFGLGAASYLQHRRFTRPRSMAAYKAWVAAFQQSGTGVPGHDQPVEDADERLLDMVMLRLRLSNGLDFRVVAEQFGEERASSIRSALRRHVDRGLVEERGACVRLTDPEGFLMSNDIISDAFAALD